MSNSTLDPMTSHYINSSNSSGPRGPPPWYLFPECIVAPYGFLFYYGVKVFNLVVGAPSNALVMWQIITKKSDGSTCDAFIFNLALLDTYFCLMTPIDLVNSLVLNNRRVWYFQRFAYGVKDAAPLFLVCICLDRYMAVVHPVLFASVRDNKLRICISVVVWGLNLAYSLAKCIMGSMNVTEAFSAIILLAFTIMLFCNISIIWVLRRSMSGKEVMHPVKKKAFKMVVIILAIIVVNYLPPVALMPFVSYYTFVEYRCQISISVYSIMDLSSSIEPLLHISKMECVDGGCCGSIRKKPHDPTV